MRFFFFFFLHPPVKYCAMEGVTQILHHCSNTRNEILYQREITEEESKSISVFYLGGMTEDRKKKKKCSFPISETARGRRLLWTLVRSQMTQHEAITLL